MARPKSAYRRGSPGFNSQTARATIVYAVQVYWRAVADGASRGLKGRRGKRSATEIALEAVSHSISLSTLRRHVVPLAHGKKYGSEELAIGGIRGILVTHPSRYKPVQIVNTKKRRKAP